MKTTRGHIAALALATCLAGCSVLPKHDLAGMLHPPSVGEDTQFVQARELERAGGIGRAKQIYERLLEQNPEMSEAMHRLGVIAAKQGDLELAMTHLDRARSLDPENAEVLADIGYVLYLQNRSDEAIDVLQEVLAIAPENERAYNNLGLVLGRQGRMAEAHAMFRNIGTEAEALTSLGYVYAQRGELDAAQRSFSHALDKDEDLQVAAEGLIQADQQRKTMARLQLADESQTEPAQPARQSLDSLSDDELAALARRLNRTIDSRRTTSDVQAVSHTMMPRPQASLAAPGATLPPAPPARPSNGVHLSDH